MRLRVAVLISLFSCVVAAGAQVQTQTPAPAIISGRVIRAGAGDPLKKAIVTLRLAPTQNAPQAANLNGVLGGLSEQQGRQQNRNQNVTTKDDGTYVFNNVPAGQYRVSVERDGYINQEYGQRSPNGSGTVITVSLGQRLTTIDFQMVSAGTIAGRILDEDNEP